MTHPAAKNARESFASGITKPLAWRRNQLAALARLIEEQRDVLSEALEADLGKSAQESWATELGIVRSEALRTRRKLRAWTRPARRQAGVSLMPARAWTQLEPLGAVLIIAPWNYPINLSLTPLIGSIAAGNSAVLKPSEVAPATSRALAALLPRYLSEDAVRVIEGGVPETTALLAEPWDLIFYTGNGEVARIVARAAADHLTPTVLELGGKSPVYVDGSVDLRVAARRIAFGKFTNAGQTCVAPDYLLVERSAATQLEIELRQVIHEMFGGDALHSPSLGRIINRKHFDRLHAYLSDGRMVVGGAVDVDQLRIAPTVLADVPAESPLRREEIFGPILPIFEVAGPAEAIAHIRQLPKPLALYTFTKNRRVRRAFQRGTSSGSLVHGLTIAQLASPELPFGGVGASGMGSYHGEASVRAFSHERSLLSKPLHPDTLAAIYPPETPAKAALQRKLL